MTRLVCVYAPACPSSSPRWYRTLHRFVGISTSVILLGDWNLVLDPRDDRLGSPRTVPRAASIAELRSLLTQYRLSDAWSHLHGHRWGGTWSLRGSAARLDRAYLSPIFLPALTSVDVCPLSTPEFYVSDHSLLLVQLHANRSNRGPGVWRLNPDLLESPSLIQDLRQTANSILSDDSVPLPTRWDVCKTAWRHKIIQAGKDRARDRRKRIRYLLYQIEAFQNGGSRTPAVASTITELQAQLFRHLHPSDLQATPLPDSHIDRLTSPEGTSTQPDEIVEMCFRRFSSLYGKPPIPPSDRLPSYLQVLPPFTEEDPCSSPFTAGELLATILSLPSGKAPGPDGLPVELYKVLWPCIGSFFTNLCNHILEHAELPASFGGGIIKLLPKSGDLTLLDNWRPVSCITTDWKIFTTALLRRVRAPLLDSLSQHQFCCVPSLSTASLACLLRDVEDYVDRKQLPALFVALDQSKAFDRVDHGYLLSLLRHLGLPRFSDLLGVLYNHARSFVLVNGFPSQDFPLTSGLRQGCPLSPLLYALVLDPALRYIHADPLVEGFPIPGIDDRLKIVAYADDVTLVVRSFDSLNRALGHFREYASLSGGALNLVKSHVLPFGTLRHLSSSSPLPLASKLQIMGITFPIKNTLDTWESFLARLSRSLDPPLGARDIPISERAKVADSRLAAFLQYPAQVVRMPKAVAKTFSRPVFRYIWCSSVDLVERCVLRNAYEDGGLNVLDPAHFAAAVALRSAVASLSSVNAACRGFSRYACSYLTARLPVEPSSLSVPKAESPSAFYVAAAETYRAVRSTYPDTPMA